MLTPSEWFELVKTIFSALGAVGAAIAAYYGIKSKRWGRNAVAYAAQASDQATGAAVSSAQTSNTVGDLKDRFDDVYAALIEERLQEARVRKVEDVQTRLMTQQQQLIDNQDRILEYMAAHELAEDQQAKAVITGTHVLDAARENHAYRTGERP